MHHHFSLPEPNLAFLPSTIRLWNKLPAALSEIDHKAIIMQGEPCLSFVICSVLEPFSARISSIALHPGKHH